MIDYSRAPKQYSKKNLPKLKAKRWKRACSHNHTKTGCDLKYRLCLPDRCLGYSEAPKKKKGKFKSGSVKMAGDKKAC